MYTRLEILYIHNLNSFFLFSFFFLFYPLNLPHALNTLETPLYASITLPTALTLSCPLDPPSLPTPTVELTPSVPSLTPSTPVAGSRPDGRPSEVPGPPRSVFASYVGKRSVTLTWRAPHDEGTSPVEMFTIYWTEDGSDRCVHHMTSEI